MNVIYLVTGIVPYSNGDRVKIKAFCSNEKAEKYIADDNGYYIDMEIDVIDFDDEP